MSERAKAYHYDCKRWWKAGEQKRFMPLCSIHGAVREAEMQRQQAPSGLKLGSSQHERGWKARLRASNYPPPLGAGLPHTKIVKTNDNSIQINDTTNNCHTPKLLKQMTTTFKSMTPPIIVTH